jgi:hypothetical protein
VIVAQGTCIGRVGRLYIRRDDKTGSSGSAARPRS